MASTIKVNNIQNQCGANIVNKCSTTITLGASGDTIQLACGASQTGFGRTGTVNWDTTAKTAGFTAVSGNGYFVNTTSGAITATLPAGSAGAIVAFADYANTFDTNALTIAPNGTDKIGGTNGNATVSTEGASTTFVYVDSTQGWKQVNDATLNTIGESFIVATGGTITTCGDYKIHTFTGPGTFCVSSLASSPSNDVVDYLVVAGGGSGGPRHGGGGGAGGFRESSGAASGCYSRSPLGACVSALPVSVTGYPVTVGGGGAASSNPGSNSVFSTITSAGGGSPAGPNCGPGGNGGSGSGSNSNGASPGCGGTGNTPPVAPPQGNNGGNYNGNNNYDSGGGGGATGAGAPNVEPQVASGAGGAGATTSISGTPTGYAGGGGGGSYNGTGGAGGSGGGGRGSSGNNPSSTVLPGTTNTGGGGGGGGGNDSDIPDAAGAGGSGIVIIRYKYQ